MLYFTLTYLHCIIFKREAWNLAAIRCYQSCCPNTAVTTHEVCTDAISRSPGDMIISPHIKSEQLFPGAVVWVPLQAGVIDVPSSTKNVIVHSVKESVLR